MGRKGARLTSHTEQLILKLRSFSSHGAMVELLTTHIEVQCTSKHTSLHFKGHYSKKYIPYALHVCPVHIKNCKLQICCKYTAAILIGYVIS